MNKNPGRPRPRREAIVGLVRAGRVPSQDALGRLLRARGFAVAQPTLSRDVRALGLAKTARGYALPGAAGRPDSSPTGAPLDRALREFVLCVQAAGSLVVVKTPSAAA